MTAATHTPLELQLSAELAHARAEIARLNRTPRTSRGAVYSELCALSSKGANVPKARWLADRCSVSADTAARMITQFCADHPAAFEGEQSRRGRPRKG